MGWQEWEAPYDTDPDWPAALREALAAYRAAWRGKMDEVNAAIAASAPQETLYDQPLVARNVLRVSGPFTVEGVQPVEETFDLETPIGGAPEELETFAQPDLRRACERASRGACERRGLPGQDDPPVAPGWGALPR